MNLDEEQKYQHNIDQIIIQLENLFMDILLTSINRLNIHYQSLSINDTYQKHEDNIPF